MFFDDFPTMRGDVHFHKCDDCGHVWAHGGHRMVVCSEKEHDDEHHCPKCNEAQFWKAKVPDSVADEALKEWNKRKNGRLVRA